MGRHNVHPIVRFYDKLLIGDGCWIWTGSTAGNGYGRLRYGHGKRHYAHRLLYEILVGPIPDGMDLDHLCRNPPCCRPDHLEPVTRSVNVQRGWDAGRVHHGKEKNATHS